MKIGSFLTSASFLGELAKRALKWPKHFSNTAARVALETQSAKSLVVQRKLTFMRRTLSSSSLESNRLAAAAFKALVDDPESLCLVKECRETRGSL